MALSLSNDQVAPPRNHGVLADTAIDPSGLAILAAENQAIGLDEVYDDFWKPVEFDILKWDRLFPYQLAVVDVLTDNSGNIHYQLHKNAVFTLPLPPESLTQDIPFAIQTTVTLGGINEEHNGAPIRPFSFRGSVGYLPLRGTYPYIPGFETANNITQGFIQTTVNQIAGIASKVTFNTHQDSDFTSDANISKTTGYYQIAKLKEFLEQYVNIKKTSKGKNLRLALCIWKDSEVYLVTPTRFSVSKDVSSPMEYRYGLDFLAWKRIDLGSPSNSFQFPTPVRNSPSGLAKVITTLSQARSIVQQAGNVPQAMLGDINHIDQVFRQSINFCKDLAGTIQNFNDMPDAVKTSIKNRLSKNNADFNKAGQQVYNSVSKVKIEQLSMDVPTIFAGDAARSVVNSNKLQTYPSKKLPYKVIQDIKLNDIPIDQFNGILDSKTKAQITNDTIRTRQLTRSDFETMRDNLVSFYNKLSLLLGAGDTTFADTYGIGSVRAIKEEPTDSDWNLLWALNDSVIALDTLAATGVGEPLEPAKLVDSIATLARASGIAFTKPVSKFAVPFPYGATLESLALQYLGDANRAIEIAALNGLKDPYIDETGFDLALLVNGLDNRVLVSYSKNLYVGQKITVSANSVTKTVRHITDLKQDLNGNYQVTLDGDYDLERYKSTDNALLHAYLPDTVNSQSLIYIPSDQNPIENDYLTREVVGVDSKDPMIMAGGVDLLLDSNKDLIITDDGDTKLATGLANIIQNLEIAFSIKQGKLFLHQGWGLPLAVGDSTADIDAKSVVSAVKKMLQMDKTFSRVGRVDVVKTSDSVAIQAAAVVSGSKSYLPISFGLI